MDGGGGTSRTAVDVDEPSHPAEGPVAPSPAPSTTVDIPEGLYLVLERMVRAAPLFMALRGDTPQATPVYEVVREGDASLWSSYGDDDGDTAGVADDDEEEYGDDDDDGGFGAVPASGVAIATLPQTVAAGEKQCAVCLDGYEAGDALRTMPCAHGFHERCIFSWLLVSRLCPLCRFALPADTETEPYDDAHEEDAEDGGGDDDGHGQEEEEEESSASSSSDTEDDSP